MGLIRHKESSRLLRKILSEPDATGFYLILRAHNRPTANHSARTALLAIDLGIDARAPRHVLWQLGFAGLFHDGGKLYVPNEILNKFGPLTEEERKIVEEHPLRGYEYVVSLGKPDVAKMVVGHHEPTENYPRAYRGDNGWGELVTLADLADSMLKARSYKKAYEPKEAMQAIRQKYTSHPEFLALLEYRLSSQE